MKQRKISSIFLAVLLMAPSCHAMQFIKDYFQTARDFLYNSNTQQRLFMGAGLFGAYVVWNGGITEKIGILLN